MLTDIVFAAFASAALYAWWLAREPGSARRGWTIAFFAASGLAVLTKGPLGTIVPLLAVVSFRWRAKERSPLTLRDVCLGVLVYAVIVVPWYAYMLARFGREYFDAFFVHENLDRLLHAEHPSNNHFWFYAAILFGGALPWMPIVALTVARGIRERKRTTPVRRFVWCWLLSSFVFLTIAQSKLPSYALFLFVPLAILCGETIDEVIERGFANSLERWLTLGVGIVQASALFTAGIWVPAARELRVPALCAALLLVAALALSWRKRPTFTALVLPALCPLLRIVTGCAWHIDAIEELTSVRGAVAQVIRWCRTNCSCAGSRTTRRKK
jgi:4-amino-4-deoxy-L-arabinose transferase-like glycosyltransferase